MTAVRAVDRSRNEPNTFARELFGDLPRRYDLLEEVLSFRQNHRWRRAMVDAVLAMQPAPRLVLDVATGTAGVALDLVRHTGARVVGVDVTEEMLRTGLDRVNRQHRGHETKLVAGRAEQLPFADATFDALTFTYLLRYVADPGATVAELARVVRPGGVVSSLEFFVPSPPVWLPAWRLYTRLLLPAGGFLGGGRAWAEVGRFLGPSIEEHYRRYPVADQVAMWRNAGLVDVHTRPMSLGGGLVMWGRRDG
jgi:demethylmenaquinone methyltransferase/2-methoxy-6-polyprenyl-1,4-benzoquinol methylase